MVKVDRFDFVEVPVPAGTEWVELVSEASQSSVRIPTFERDGGTRARLMPREPGRHRWQTLSLDPATHGEFNAVEAGAKGMLVADGTYFRWSGTGEPFFWNSTTAYFLSGLREDRAYEAIDRLVSFGVNRLRVSLTPSRQPSGERWMEPQVGERDDFTYRYGPWIAQNPGSWSDPAFDVNQLDEAYWSKFERILRYARAKDIVVQVVIFTDAQEPQNYPFDRERIDDPNERAFYRNVVARLGSFSNVEWCLTNEWMLFRADEWVEAIGNHVAELDGYRHLTSVHGHGRFPFVDSPWCTHALYQVWDEHGSHDWVAERFGTKPIVNEEFGYEDHYPTPWGEAREAPSRDASSRLRLAWEIVMAGGWCTTGETAATGHGGWINGLNVGDSALFQGHLRQKAFFESFEWWSTVPADHLVTGHAYCRANVGQLYVIYAFAGAQTMLKLPDSGPWNIRRFDVETGEWSDIALNAELRVDPYAGVIWVSEVLPRDRSIAFVIQRAEPAAS